MLKILQYLFKALLRIIGGRKLGRRYPFLWKVYDFFFRLAAPKVPFNHVMSGYKFLVDPNEPVKHVRKWMQNYMMSDVYEPETTEVVRGILDKNSVAIDIGASIGYFSMLCADLVGPKGTVFSFEPTREGFKYLCENKKLNGFENIIPYNLAAWNKNEPVRMPASSYATNAQWANGVDISDFLEKNHGITRVDFIKMDIDGAEPWAIDGLEKIVTNSPDLIMICEYYPEYIEASGGDPQKYLDFLHRYFDVEVLEDDYGNGCWNYLCKRKNR